MLIALLALCISALVFSLLILFTNYIQNNSGKIENRMKGISTEKEEKAKARKLRSKFRKEEKAKNQIKVTKSNKKLEQLEDTLYNIGIKAPIQTVFMAWGILIILVPAMMILLFHNSGAAFISFVLVIGGPVFWVKRKKSKRKSAIEGQLVEAISVMCNALKAGHSFQTAMASIAKEMEAPISEEFGRVSRETQRGMTLEDSMNRMVERTGSADLDMLCTAILIQRKVGGNLAEVLDKISETVKNRIGLRAEIKTRTSSGRVSGYIVGALPVFLLLVMTFLNRDYASNLYDTTAGHYMLIFSVVWECIGFAIINKIVTIKY